MALPAPDLGIPASNATVDVSIIDTTATIRGVETYRMMQPTIKGHEHLVAPCYSFLIHHPRLNRRLVFDLGIRKDYWNISPFLIEGMKGGDYEIIVEKNVADILQEHDVELKTIEGVIWSHWHLDHIGDTSTFDPSTTLIVGPGFKEHLLPGYPANPKSPILETDYTGRELRELTFSDSGIKIGKIPAFDYFGDGSFYLLDTPGHTIGHLCGFARVTSNPDSFIFMGGDCSHHMGELRPSPYMPLPESIEPHPFGSSAAGGTCCGAIFKKLLPNGDTTKPFYSLTKGTDHFNGEDAQRTADKVKEVDVQDNILVVLAHDEYMLDVVDFFPKTANDFVAKGWFEKTRWTFLKDFKLAAGQ